MDLCLAFSGVMNYTAEVGECLHVSPTKLIAAESKRSTMKLFIYKPRNYMPFVIIQKCIIITGEINLSILKASRFSNKHFTSCIIYLQQQSILLYSTTFVISITCPKSTVNHGVGRALVCVQNPSPYRNYCSGFRR